MIEQYNNHSNYYRVNEENIAKLTRLTNNIENHLINNQTFAGRPNSSNYRDVINESQRTIQEINKEALREFQTIIKNEIHQSNFIYPLPPQAEAQKLSSFIPTVNNEHKKDFEITSDFGTIITVDDVISDDEDQFDRDSMDTDSLLNVRIESPEPVAKPTANKKDAESDFSADLPASRNLNNYNLVNHFSNFQKKRYR